MKSFEYFLKTVKNERWDPSQSIHGPWNDPEPFFEANEQLTNYIDSAFGITPEMWDTLMDKDKSESYMKLEDEVSQKFSDLYQKNYVIGYNNEFDAEEVNDEYKKLSKEIETELKDVPYPKRAKEFNYRLNKAIFDNHLNEFKEIYSKYFTLSESVFKIQKPNQEAFANVVDGKGTCTECGAENVPVENHVCTTKISEASENSIIKKVNMVNQLIKLAIDDDGDPIPVVDTSGTWQAHNYYEPIVYSNGGLIIKYKEGKDIIKDRINKSDMEYEGIPTLNNIAKMYRKALKQHNIKFNENLTIDQFTEADAFKLFDYVERTGMLPDNISAEDFKQIIAKYDIKREYDEDDDDLDPAGGRGLHSHESMITSLEQFKKINENNQIRYTPLVDAMEDLKSGIENDASIQRYSLQWKDVISVIDKLFSILKYNYVHNKDIQFSNKLITNVLTQLYSYDEPGLTKELIDVLEVFAKELQINIDTLHAKFNENINVDPDVEKLNQELDTVHSWLKGTTEPFDDWFWDGYKLSLYINGTDEPVETYTRQELIEAGVNLSAE